MACDALWDTRLDDETLLELTARLGSDVPFALPGGKAVGLGRGKRLTVVEVTGESHWVFGYAEGGPSTPVVYAECDRLRVAGALTAALNTGDPVVRGALRNDLEPAALAETGRFASARAAYRSVLGSTTNLGHSLSAHPAPLTAKFSVRRLDPTLSSLVKSRAVLRGFDGLTS